MTKVPEPPAPAAPWTAEPWSDRVPTPADRRGDGAAAGTRSATGFSGRQGLGPASRTGMAAGAPAGEATGPATADADRGAAGIGSAGECGEPVPFTAAQVWQALDGVSDPEIPMVSVVELGIVQGVAVEPGGRRVVVTITPTFTGCPALHVMREEIERAVRRLGATEVEVPVTLNPAWTSDRISESARVKMQEIGLAPPARHSGAPEAVLTRPVACPFCGSTDTALENPFGPTLCRALYYCHTCQQPFEQFKPL